jgi:hypothetical protein
MIKRQEVVGNAINGVAWAGIAWLCGFAVTDWRWWLISFGGVTTFAIARSMGEANDSAEE